MELLLVLCLCISTWTGKTLCDENDVPRHATEGSDAILPCSPIKKDNLTDKVFDWKKNDGKEVFLYDNGKHYNNGKTGQDEDFINRVDFFEDQLQFGNASIRIKKTKLTDSGIYSCTFPNLDTQEQKFSFELVVKCILKDRTLEKPTKPDVCPKPSFITEKGRRVKCSVPVVSDVEMELHNRTNKSVGQLVEDGTSQNSKYFIFSVTEEGYYRCLVKQKEYCHQIYSEENFAEKPDTKNRAEGEKKIKLNLLLLLVVVGILLP